ncbi:Formylglycine-generating enzyme, required for sulfatase activity, contains SUMF1/FGE domain [Thiothrix caldifontis]|uniref:Formylglycine-generating enzyme, required for sulfatase activity, contains SUMF1/FGE domain n=1 Tax=Thiothrix caldifontis TaxID=525918 RepID=A0A1H4DVX9_9GAMM|nr:formylglycine-generating enzyme family protein [Thiothrix caldifontis]SEA76955.1 Formylglycine-generating enzyme, required for sulfatase activity, contains SUMF1/FGE domain [Thiothrix caldifontis]
MRTHKIFPTEFPEPWASDWGEDEYGLFMGFTYKGVRQDFRWIEPGTFLMGSPEDEAERRSNEIQHEVTLSKGFWLANTAVTQSLWETVMGNNFSRFKDKNHPVDNVSWNDAQAFISKMNSMKEELQLSLPTEAQWEYACRAGTSTPFYLGEQINSERANFNGTTPYNNGRESEFRQQTVEVGTLHPNDWGLYEMHGNVQEWCQNWFSNYPVQPSLIDPIGPETGEHRVLRGGSWFSNGSGCRAAYRDYGSPTYRSGGYGFRFTHGFCASASRVMQKQTNSQLGQVLWSEWDTSEGGDGG